VIKGSLIGLLTTKIMKKRKLLQAKMCEELYTLKLSPVRGLESTPPVTKYRLPLKAPTRMYAILLFIFILRE
jgi:hypothetical protein